MLEKNQTFFYDAHLHFTTTNEFLKGKKLNFYYKACSVCHSLKEWNDQMQISQTKDLIIYNAYGVHPQSLIKITKKQIDDELFFLENLLQNNAQNEHNKKIYAIGELGFDLYTLNLKKTEQQQKEVFWVQMELAIKYNLPVIIHSRKANNLLFNNVSLFKKVPSVLFHAYMGPSLEAKSLLNKNINAFFSFGKQLFNNNKKAIECAKNLPINNLLLETDAPFGTLKGEEYTKIDDIIKVYNQFCSLRNVKMEQVAVQMENNFNKMFML